VTPERYFELSERDDLPLTEEETAEGWRFCGCEWDGLLICAGDPEAKVCSCFYDDEGRLKCE
jgi:hypothetical protein